MGYDEPKVWGRTILIIDDLTDETAIRGGQILFEELEHRKKQGGSNEQSDQRGRGRSASKATDG